MTAEEFYKIEDPDNNDNYDGIFQEWLFDKRDMIRFAERYYEARTNISSICSVKKCPEPVYEFGYCFKHYCIDPRPI